MTNRVKLAQRLAAQGLVKSARAIVRGIPSRIVVIEVNETQPVQPRVEDPDR